LSAVVAIVGRSNVGKSALFNRLIKKRRAIVHNSPHVTRDRIFASVAIEGRSIWLIDTGGLEVGVTHEFSQPVSQQAMIAAKDADLLLVVFDGREGLLVKDEEIVNLLRVTNKPMVGVVNKIDPGFSNSLTPEFYRLGINPFIEVSAEHSRGIGLLESTISEILSEKGIKEEKLEGETGRVQVAFAGRPNVGKSSLINAILNEPRLIVSEIPGTTRDVVDTPLQYREISYLLLDTAGIRKRGKMENSLEYFSVTRALRAIDRADVIGLLMDAKDQLTTQDERIASAIMEKGRGLMLLANKWDLCQDSPAKRKEFREEIYSKAPFLKFAQVRFVSAKTGLGIEGILPEAFSIFKNRHRQFSKEGLQKVFVEISSAHVPGGSAGFRLRLNSLTMADESIPTFFLWCNDPRLIEPAYERYWRNALCEKLELRGIPIRVIARRLPRGKKRPSVRRKTKLASHSQQ